MKITMGNLSAKEGYHDPQSGEKKTRMLSDNMMRTTHIGPSNHKTMAQIFIEITNEPNGVWVHHSSDPPAWVEADDPAIQMLLASHYGCQAGKPDYWVDGEQIPAEAHALNEANKQRIKAQTGGV